jgi:hypothetical protein
MEANGTRRFVRIAPRRAAVLLTLGAVVVGLSACGSSSDSSAKGSTSTVVKKEAVKKEAGYKDVQLEVTNKNAMTLFVTACADTNGLGHGPCHATGNLATNESTHLTSAAVGGSIWFRDNIIEYRAKNPDIGEPSITLWLRGGTDNDTFKNQQDAPQFNLSEGQTVEKDVGGHLFDMARGGDTDVKVMSLTVR